MGLDADFPGVMSRGADRERCSHGLSVAARHSPASPPMRQGVPPQPCAGLRGPRAKECHRAGESVPTSAVGVREQRPVEVGLGLAFPSSHALPELVLGHIRRNTYLQLALPSTRSDCWRANVRVTQPLFQLERGQQHAAVLGRLRTCRWQ